MVWNWYEKGKIPIAAEDKGKRANDTQHVGAGPRDVYPTFKA